jgi:hypothetical protein
VQVTVLDFVQVEQNDKGESSLLGDKILDARKEFAVGE